MPPIRLELPAAATSAAQRGHRAEFTFFSHENMGSPFPSSAYGKLHHGLVYPGLDLSVFRVFG